LRNASADAHHRSEFTEQRPFTAPPGPGISNRQARSDGPEVGARQRL